MIIAYNTVQKPDITCISKTYLNSSVNENLLLIPGYHLLRANHPENLKKGGVCLYYKEHLSLRQIETPYFSQCILCKLTIQNKIGYVAVVYRSPSQSVNEFDDFLLNYEKFLNHISQLKSSFLVTLGDFNARSRSWWCEDITSRKGAQLESLTISCVLHQLISDQTHLLPNSSSCTDLIFTDQPNLVADSGVHPSLHPYYYHQITFSRYNLNVQYPSDYERLVWDYNKANTASIKQALMQINLQNLFLNKDFHQQVRTLNCIMINVFSNFIPNKVVTFNDRDPPWMTVYVKTKIQQRDNIFKNYLRSSKNNQDFKCLQITIDDVSNTKCKKKSDCYNQLAQKLIDPTTDSKTFRSILKNFVNGKNIPLLPPLNVGNKLVTDFKDKARLFNKFFASKCTSVTNDSSFPSLLNLNLIFRLVVSNFTEDDILKIIKPLNINKAHGRDDISIRMIKMFEIKQYLNLCL